MSGLKTVGLMVGVSIFLVLAQVFLKLALEISKSETGLAFLLSNRFWSLLFSKYFVGASIAMVISFFLWLYVLQQGTELSRVYPLISFSYILMAFVAHFALGEKFTLQKMVGILIICVGITVLFWKNEPPLKH